MLYQCGRRTICREGLSEAANYKSHSRWDRYLGMTAAMTQVPVPTATDGVVAKSYGIPKQIALKGAGYYQIYSGTSSPNWIAGKLMKISTMTPSGIISTSREHIMLAPYGDDPKDQHWIRQGYKY